MVVVVLAWRKGEEELGLKRGRATDLYSREDRSEPAGEEGAEFGEGRGGRRRSHLDGVGEGEECMQTKGHVLLSKPAVRSMHRVTTFLFRNVRSQLGTRARKQTCRQSFCSADTHKLYPAGTRMPNKAAHG